MATTSTAPKTLAAPSGHRPAAKAGYTPKGLGGGKWQYVQNVAKAKAKAKPAPPTDPLAPLSPKAIKTQAQTTIGDSFKPAYTDLNTQSSRAQAISNKRTQDNKFYTQWLDSKMNELQSHANAANAVLGQTEQGLQQQQSTLYGGQQQSLVDQANARAGNVSNNQQSNSFGAQLAQNQQTNEGLLNAASQEAIQGMGTQNDQLGAARANDFNVVQAGQTKQLADLNVVLGKIADARLKLNSQKVSDTAKEIARLQGVEIQKAQSNRDYAAAVQKLGIQAANVSSEIGTRAGNLKVAQANAKTNAIKAENSLTKQQHDMMLADAKFKLDQQKYGDSVAKEQYLRDHGLGPYRPASGRGGSGGSKPLSDASQQVIYNHIFSIQGELRQLIAAGESPKAAWHTLHDGGAYNFPTGQTDAHGKPIYRYKQYAAVGDDGLLNSAYNTLSGSPGLYPGDVAYLKKLGLAHPERHLSIYTPAPVNGNPGR